MPKSYRRTLALAAVLFLASASAQEVDSRHLAPGFHTRSPGSALLIVPADMELFSISAGGVGCGGSRRKGGMASGRSCRCAAAIAQSQLASQL